MSNPIFVASPTDIAEGQHALRRLERTNDTRFETEDGVLVVDDARWEVAQAYERYSWLTHNITLTTDRNEFHAEQFAQYADLPDNLGKVVELGCGPFTNLRLILPERKASSVYLLDPLAKDYQDHHPHCTYADGTLAGHSVTVVSKPIEAWNTKIKFDTLVMINVLPHCRDANAIFEFIFTHMKKGGLVVLGEFPREHPASTHYDAGHPIALKTHVVESFLAEFEEIYRNGWYFIGRVR